ncbi:hypothetical protein [Apibacter adventoris]|uniref:Lipoprotein n=1 Tax=Apibacter adventoris TaxID=1679466 RepID=A0A2S8AET9_9FLAO|nr:hypothetical protein [Apibacter adventoris]PQL93775.1 hypothetical protein C4S77_04275 [Apibacter adventoris]
MIKKIIYNWILVLGILILSGCSSMVLDNTFCENILGLDISINKELYKYEEDGVRGKGVLFIEYLFNKKHNNLFIDKKDYPHSYDIRKDWQLSQWEEVSLIDKRVFKLIGEYNIVDEKFRQYISIINDLILSENNLVSYYYKERNGYFYAIEMYLIDVSNNKLYFLYMKV